MSSVWSPFSRALIAFLIPMRGNEVTAAWMKLDTG